MSGGLMRRCVVSMLVVSCLLPAQSKKVIANLPPEMLRELTQTAPQVRIVSTHGADFAKEIVDADAVVGIPLTPEMFKVARQLKWLHISSAGVDQHANQSGLFPELIESNVVV